MQSIHFYYQNLKLCSLARAMSPGLNQQRNSVISPSTTPAKTSQAPPPAQNTPTKTTGPQIPQRPVSVQVPKLVVATAVYNYTAGRIF